MALLVKPNTFSPGSVAQSSQVNANFDALYQLLNGTTTNIQTLLRYSDATDFVLIADQVGAGAIQAWRQSGAEKSSIRNNGGLRINSTQGQVDPCKIAVNMDANNLNAALAVLQSAGATDVGLRIAMEAASSGSVVALQMTKFEAAAVRTYMQLAINGELRVAAGHPAATANTPTKMLTVGGQVYQQINQVGNVGAGATDLHSITIDANVMAQDGDSMQIYCAGFTANNGVNKTISPSLAGTNLYSTGAVANQNIFWRIDIEVVRISSTTAQVSTRFTTYSQADQSLQKHEGYAQNALSITWANNNTFKVSATGTSNNDIVQTATTIRKFPKGV